MTVTERKRGIDEELSVEEKQLRQENEEIMESEEDESMGEYEDVYEDDVEDDEPLNGDAVMDQDEDEDFDEDKIHVIEEETEEIEQPVQVFVPGSETAPLKEGEELQVNQRAYDMLHTMNTDWPCLSFDILQDSLGAARVKFPMTCFSVAGTQADRPVNNRLLIMKMSSLHKTKRDGMASDEEEEESDAEDEAENVDDDPVLEVRTIRHFGGINRIRAMPNVPNRRLVATWADTGKVHIYDITKHFASLERPAQVAAPSAAEDRPIYTVNQHKEEGYAMDWSHLEPGKLLTGDCQKFVYLTTANESGQFTTVSQPFSGHSASVEDIQWSPTENNVFASCGVDQTLRIWDARKRTGSALSGQVHECDVNVLSWNGTARHLMATGADDGTFSIWDLRHFKSSAPQPAATFSWHKGPITSLEWHPTDESTLAVAGDDDQITVWDLSVERDDDVSAQDPLSKLPPQLMFIHMGQHHIKELHWHSQLTSVLMSTSESGFNIFRTANAL